jgi:hypothetical protein
LPLDSLATEAAEDALPRHERRVLRDRLAWADEHDAVEERGEQLAATT